MAQWLNQFDGQIAVQPPLTEPQLAAIPAKRGVVLLVGQGQAPILLITAADMRGRLRTRLEAPREDKRTKRADLRDITAAICWKTAWSHFEADWHFLRAAAAIWPKTYTKLLSWKPPWFVHVDPSAAHPRFTRTQEVFGQAGRYVGPFPSGQAAEKFIESLLDAFDLCRVYRCLLQAPHSPPCPYAQMGRCLSVCDGTTSLEDYRAAVARAAAFADGDRQPLREQLEARMKAAAGQMQYEQAAVVKSRLERLKDFDKSAYTLAAPAEQFRFVAIQAGGGGQKACTFLIDRGWIEAGPPLDYPPAAPQLAAVLEAMARFCARERPREERRREEGPREEHLCEEYRRWAMGLVSHYLQCSPQRRGLILRWDEKLTAEALAGELEKAADALRLRVSKRRKKA